MSRRTPRIVALAGPNGAGKSTSGPTIIGQTMQITEFVNADVIARGLSGFDPDRAAWAAGRIMLERMRALAARHVDFAFETTLAGRSFAPWIEELLHGGYEFHLHFFWLPDAEFAVRRVQERLRAGGHGVPEDVVRRRYRAGLVNFFELYKPLAARWHVYDNTEREPRIVALGSYPDLVEVFDEESWNEIARPFLRG